LIPARAGIISAVKSKALEVLNRVFGYESFRPPQGEVIDCLLDGQDVLVLMPTGGGKSLCYQIPALVLPGVAVVISPLIALMQDQVNALKGLGIRASFINSTLTTDEYFAVKTALMTGELDLLYVAPERLVQGSTLDLLAQIPLSLFAIDEAHCVSQWGHNFRVDYLGLKVLGQRFPKVPRIALTATADDTTRLEIIRQLDLRDEKMFVSGFDRPNIQYLITEKNKPRQQLLNFIKRNYPNSAGIVYCLSRKKVDSTAAWLASKGFLALPYHAGMDSELRKQTQDRFLNEEKVIVVATIAFGMGIDKPDVRFVAHLDLPKSIESYYQETGRAGRDGHAATAWMAYGIQDVVLLRQLIERSNGNEQIRHVERFKLDTMLGFCEITSCRRQALLNYFGEDAPDQCGNCDACLNPADTWDGTEWVRKALSCIYRTEQKFGVNHLIDVLLGHDTDKIKKFSHDQVSTYGIGVDLAEGQWRSVFRQITARGFVDVNEHGALFLTEKCRGILKGEEQVHLRRDVVEKTVSRPTVKQVELEDRDLWMALKACRKRLSELHSVPSFVVFHDATLLDMIEVQPRNLHEFSQLSGVGQTKLEKYGEEFIDVIARQLEKEQLAADFSE